ncbi:MAG TPA: KH domain-containing protein [Acidimicrobiales bacterium]|nr:KH domain-containing protein [Acidimicrobiales bacterium]
MTVADGSESAEYEAGDVNVVDDAAPAADLYGDDDVNTVDGSTDDGYDDDDDLDGDDLDGDDAGIGNEADTDTSTEVLSYVARALANEPDAVVIETEQRRGSTVLRLHVAPEDMGRVIGRRGRTAQAIRTLVGAAGARDGITTVVDIVDA